MTIRSRLLIAVIATLAISTSLAQSAVSEVEDPNEVLKVAALEALISAPPERALPLVIKVLDTDNTDEVKERALFVLSQIDLPGAGLDFWRGSEVRCLLTRQRRTGLFWLYPLLRQRTPHQCRRRCRIRLYFLVR